MGKKSLIVDAIVC